MPETIREIENICDADGRRLEISRIDLAADVSSVPVDWFLEHLRAKWKRFTADIGKVTIPEWASSQSKPSTSASDQTVIGFTTKLPNSITSMVG